MNLWKIAWRSIQQRSVASVLTGLSMALGVSLVVAVLLIGQIVQKSFRSGNELGYNVIVGAKGGRLDLLLNSVYYLNRPIENIPWEYYQELLHADDRTDHKAGKFAADVSLAIPICLGDVLGEAGQYRVVGTTPDMFSKLLHSTFSSGECFKQNDFRTAVIGAEVARTENLKVGDSFKPAHGVGGEKHMPFKITGILDRTGTPNDRAAFVNMEGFFLIPDHAKGHVEEVHKPGEKEVNPEDEFLDKPLPEDQREVTSVLVRTAGALPELTAPDLVKRINKEFVAQAIEPIKEINVLTNTFVQPLQVVLLILTVLIVIVAGIGIMVSIYNSMTDRKHEIAVMRALRRTPRQNHDDRAGRIDSAFPGRRAGGLARRPFVGRCYRTNHHRLYRRGGEFPAIRPSLRGDPNSRSYYSRDLRWADAGASRISHRCCQIIDRHAVTRLLSIYACCAASFEIFTGPWSSQWSPCGWCNRPSTR